MSDRDGGPDVEGDADLAGEPPPKPIRCGERFCPLSSSAATSCCTGQRDVARHLATAVDACGVDLSALADADMDGTDGEARCWQRDQLGIIDPRCPDHADEPGCCADDGMCGVSDRLHHRGCYHAPGAELRTCRQGSEPSTVMCDPRGTYAWRVSVDAAWEGRDSGLAALTDDGRGKIEMYLLVDINGVDPKTGALDAAGRVCGVTLPPFYSSTLCESYQPLFPDRLWEADELPRPQLSGEFTCAADGCTMSVHPTTYLFGIRLDNPEASWPTPDDTRRLRCPDLPRANCFADDDGDGEPGVTVELLTEGSSDTGGTCRSYRYRAAPLNDTIAAIFNGVRRADRLQVGIRARVGGSVRFGESCETAAGSALAEYVNSRAQGCYVQPGSYDLITNSGPAGLNERCRRSEAEFIDLSMPVYRVLSPGERPGTSRSNRDDTPSQGPTVSIVRFAAGVAAGCAEARQAKF